MKAMHLIAPTVITLALLGGCSRDEPERPVTAPENTNQVPQQVPRNDTDLQQNRNTQDPAMSPTTDNPYSPTEDPYAPTDDENQGNNNMNDGNNTMNNNNRNNDTNNMGEGSDGASAPADDEVR